MTVYSDDHLIGQYTFIGEPAPYNPGPEVPPEPVEVSVSIDEDGKTAMVTGDFDGLFARVAMVIDTNGVSGLFVTQAVINDGGSIIIPSFQVPGLTLKGVCVALLPNVEDISSPMPNAICTDYMMF